MSVFVHTQHRKNVENTHVLLNFNQAKESTYTHTEHNRKEGDTVETKQRGRPKMCRGTKQRKQDFNSKLKAYSPTALDNVIKIAETSFSAETKLKANMFLIEKAVGKNFSLLEHDNKTEQNKQTHVTLQIIEPNKNINVNDVNNEITEELTNIDNDDSEPWEEPWEEDVYHTH